MQNAGYATEAVAYPTMVIAGKLSLIVVYSEVESGYLTLWHLTTSITSVSCLQQWRRNLPVRVCCASCAPGVCMSSAHWLFQLTSFASWLLLDTDTTY